MSTLVIAAHFGHAKVEYACGHVKEQCRCPEPKPTTTLDHPCPSCAAKGWPRNLPGMASPEVENLSRDKSLPELTRMVEDAATEYTRAKGNAASARNASLDAANAEEADGWTTVHPKT